MNKSIIFGIVGAIAGGVAGFFAAKAHYKKKFDAELEAIRTTHEEINSSKNKMETETKGDKNSVYHQISIKSNDSYEDDDDSEDESDEDYDEYDLDDDRELEDARIQFEREVEEYVGTGRPYNITEDEFNTPYEGYNKVVMVINEDVDRAYDADTGEEIDDWHDIIGDKTYDTLNPERKDDFGSIYVRSENQGTDYQVTYSRFDWV